MIALLLMLGDKLQNQCGGKEAAEIQSGIPV